MRQYTLAEILHALEQEKGVPFSLYMDAAQIARRTVTENPDYAWVMPHLRQATEKYARTPIEAPTFQQYADFERTGQRSGYDQAMYQLRTRLNTMSLAVLLDVEGAKEQYEDILYAFLHLPTWSLSAHYLYGAFEDYWDIPKDPYDETGRIRGLGRDRKHSLDLCSTSAAFMLCEMAQLLEGKIEPCLIRWSRQESFERVLSPFMSLSQFPHFEINPNNWSGVCMSSIGAAAIYLITDERTLAPVLVRVLAALKVHEEGYYEDGASPEGFGYWQYGFEYMLMFSELLKRRTGGHIDLMDDGKLRRVAGFGTDCCFGKELKLPFGDCNWRGIYDEAVGRMVGSLGIPVPPQGDTKASFLSAFEHGPLQLRHLVWDMRPQAETYTHPRSAVYPVSEYYMGFYHKLDDPVYLLTKGGNNGESHNHNDVGSYVIIRGDQMLAADTAGGRYTKDYFSDKRYTFFAARSGGHNLPIVGGVEQEGHGRCRCKRFQAETAQDQDIVYMDLSGTLLCPQLTTFTRTLRGEKVTGHIEIEDYFLLTEPAEIRDRIVMLQKPEELVPGAWRVGGDAGMTLRFDAEALEVQLACVPHKVFEWDCIYTFDLIPRLPKAGETTILMTWDIQ